MASRGLALASLLALPATPGLAQKGPAPAAPFDDGFNMCSEAAGDLSALEASLVATGWTIDDTYGIPSPAASAPRNSAAPAATSTTTPWSRPTPRSASSTAPTTSKNSPERSTSPALAPATTSTGDVQTVPTGTYGSWQRLGDEDGLLILASQEEDYFYFQMNWIGD